MSKRVRTPTVLQMEVVECGAAALAIILGYYGRIVSLAELRVECGVSRDGSKAINIVKAARNYGLEAKGLKTDLNGLKKLEFPYIVFWNFNHFLVVEGFTKNRVYVNDPKTGPRTVSWQEFDAAYTGVVLAMKPGANFQPGGRKPSLILALWERLRSSVGAIAYAVLVGFFLVIPTIALPVFTQIFIDRILIAGREDWLRPLLLGLLFAGVIQAILTLLQLQALRGLKIKLAVGMSSKFVWHLLQLPISFYEQRFAGEIASRVELNDKVADLLSGKLATTIIDIIIALFYILILIQYDLFLTGIGIFFAIINVFVLAWLSRQRQDANRRLVQEYGQVSGVAIANLQNIETLKASGETSDFFSRWVGYYTKAINTQQNLSKQNQILAVLPSLLTALTSMLVLVIGGWRIIQGELTIGGLVAFGILIQAFLAPISRLVDFGSLIQELTGDLERLDDVYKTNIADNLKEDQQTNQNSSQPLQGNIELKNVTFGYSPIDPPLVENLNLTIKPGQRIALVGASGSGKSTIAKLVCGLYQPWSGKILFDDREMSEIPSYLFAQSVAFVSQDICLFAGTIRDNLTLWDYTISEQQISQACQDAVIDEITRSQPKGYNTKLTEAGLNLSGGQRQRLEIARALVDNPSLIILDEATSSLDTETERIIDQNLRKRGCTCLIVAHRLSTVRNCDEILVLSEGKVVEKGTHEELLQLKQLYWSLSQERKSLDNEELLTTDERGYTQINDDCGKHGEDVRNLWERQGYLVNVNKANLLDDPDLVWLVKSGEIAIFVVDVENGIPHGRRKYLFSVNAGEAMFGVSNIDKCQGLLAVCLQASELLKVELDEVEELIIKGDKNASLLLDNWLKYLEFPHKIALPKTKSLREYLDKLHENVFQHLNQVKQQQQAEAELRLQTQIQVNSQATEIAFGKLSHLLNPQQAKNFTPIVDSPLSLAFVEICRYLEVKIPASLPQENSLSVMSHAAGLRMRQVKLTTDWWKKDAGVILAYNLQEEQPVVLLPAKSGSYQLFNPVAKTKNKLTAKLAQKLSSHAYTFYRILPENINQKPSLVQVWQLLQFALFKRKSDLQLIFWCGIGATVLGMLTPYATAILIDYAIPAASREILLQIGLALLVAAWGRSLYQLTQGFAQLRVESFADLASQAAVWDRLLKLKASFFRQYSSGDLSSRVTTVSEIRRQFAGTILRSFLASIFALLNLGLLFYYSWKLALVACAVGLIAALTTLIFGIISLRYLRREQEQEGEVFGILIQLINGVAKLRVAGAIQRAFAYWSKGYSKQLVLRLKSQRIEDYLAVFNEVLPLVATVLLFWLAVSLIGLSKLSTGTFVAFYAAFGIFITGGINLSNSSIDLLAIASLWKRVKPILDAPLEITQNSSHPGQLDGKISLENLTFSYHQDTPNILENITINAQPGEFIALVGASGSGKSTILRLLLGLETPQAGKIKYEGQDLNSLELDAVRQQIGVVLQNSQPFSGTIFENIAGGSNITIEQAWQAVKQVDFAADIDKMPMKMQTVISVGGTNLSGGQKQRLMLARALAKQPKILLLDEATSFLDNQTQAKVSENIDKLQITRIVVAHRLTTIRNSDRVYVLDQGKIVQEGTFAQLAAQEGLFARLMQQQM
ncbi:MAG: NHLP family bacteriocin export ABC transporter peptidase/permease/ATPase subunit [Kamptonema sp. SIO1D9]|nr:NHLP family bacteriocin export ABC transporter peptidase/permease/ATPase subunit [Kamptonema sp. SIO1D9]